MKTMTVKEVLQVTAQSLNAISIPVELIEQIGMPIRGCIGNLEQVIKAMEENERPAEEQPEQGGEQDGEGDGV